MPNRRLWLMLLVVPPFLWAGNALVGRATVGQVGPLTLAFWRWILALALILPLTWRDILGNLPVLRGYWRQIIGLGVVSVSAYNSLLYMAVQTTTAINATLVGASLPLMVVAISRIWLKQPIRGRQGVGIVISLAGLLIVISKGDVSSLLNVGFTPGDGLMLLATLFWALYSVMLRRFPVPLRPFTLLAVLIVVGILGLAPFYAWEAAHLPAWHPNLATVGAIAYTAVFASLLAYCTWNQGVAAVGAATAGQYTYLIPLFTAILAVFLLDEKFRWFHAAGSFLIFGGIALATIYLPFRQAREAADEPHH